MTNVKTEQCATCCKRCGRDLNVNDFEGQERLEIRFRAGYGSVFGGGNIVRGTLCQYCVKEVLGPWLEVVEDDPFVPEHNVGVPEGAYQPYQVSQGKIPSNREHRELFIQTQRAADESKTK